MAPGKAAKGKQNAAHGKKKSGNPSVAKSKVYSEQQGLAHLITLSTQIANKKDEQQRQLLDRAQARRNKVKSEKAQHSHIVEHQPVKSVRLLRLTRVGEPSALTHFCCTGPEQGQGRDPGEEAREEATAQGEQEE